MEINTNVNPHPGNVGFTKTVDVQRAVERKDRQNRFILWYIDILSKYGEGNSQLLDKLEVAKDVIL